LVSCAPPTLFSTRSPPTATSTLSLHDALPILSSSRGGTVESLRSDGSDPRRRAATQQLPPRAPRSVAVHQPPHPRRAVHGRGARSEEHTSELQSRFDLVCRLLLEKKKKNTYIT